MFRGFYTVATGMLAQQRKTEMLTNNMSNVNTPGFKADQASMRAFPEMLLSSLGGSKVPTQNGMSSTRMTPVGGLNTGVYMQEAVPLFTQGDLRETGLTTDLAILQGDLPANEETGILGALFFTLENEDGTDRYTRNGNFALDADGFLTTPAGHYVLDENGARIELENDRFEVTDGGQVIQNGANIARVGIAYSDDPRALVKEGDGLYRAPEGTVFGNAYNVAEAGFSINQGSLERSNVDSARTMTDLMTSYRSFEANQKVLQAYDRSMEKAVNEVGRLN
ncbi:flagellar basal body rod protein subunit C [Jeotgalibacillus malaysiensis]|uniref:Flagellar basal body rod protein subunit C n=1 Tax=Jeotgalibacillus malaysiensis TaxID=1508404 RepID=A0A0B5AUQ5_9BACL|nr:flagellar hook-basal body protein [Jeotgalibacillus malaysiensis]AJD92313.1 flagellar basal body rod protein subunit C [Jeotgalibacillus malaysiensis]